MRDNGLTATSYVAIGDLDPSVADAMLGVLRDAQVAAYTEPCSPVVGPCLEIRLPPIPCDRLYVDETAEVLGRSLLGEHLPRLRDGGSTPEAATDADSDATTNAPEQEPDRARMATFDEERAWADIVAGYDLTADDAVPRWSVHEDVEPEPPGRRDARSRDAGDGSEDGADHGTPDENAVTDAGADGSDRPTQRSARQDERFVPPPPPPLPRVDTTTKVAWLALAGGPVALLLATVGGFYVPPWLALAGVVAFIGGFLTLVLRMKGGPPDDEDGAIV